MFRDLPHDDADNDQWYVKENEWCRDLDAPWMSSSQLCPHGYPDPGRTMVGRTAGCSRWSTTRFASPQFGKVVMHDVTICYEETPIANSSLADDLSWPANGSVYDNVTVVLGTRSRRSADPGTTAIATETSTTSISTQPGDDASRRHLADAELERVLERDRGLARRAPRPLIPIDRRRPVPCRDDRPRPRLPWAPGAGPGAR